MEGRALEQKRKGSSMLEHEGDFSKELGAEWIDKSVRQEGGPATL